MRTILAATLASILLSSLGCATARDATGGISHADWHVTNGEYRPWNDVNSGGLPRQRFSTFGGPYGYSNWSSPSYALR